MTGRHKAWDYPDCPECGTPVLVRCSRSGKYDYVCEGCSTLFS